MRKIIIAAFAAVLAVSGVAWADDQFAHDPFRKVGATELVSGDAKVGTVTAPLPVEVIANAVGGASVKSIIVANNTTSVAVDASAGTLYSIRGFNNSSTIAYGKLYNAAQGSTTCGSGTPVDRFMIPANSSSSGAGLIWSSAPGVKFATAITICVTTGIADNDTSAPAASTYLLSFDYK